MVSLNAAVDVVIEITLNLTDPSKSVIKTNARKEALVELLSSWLIDQIGRGKDESELNVKEEYHIKIGLSLAEDTFYTESDTGNRSVTCGLITAALIELEKLQVLPLGQ